MTRNKQLTINMISQIMGFVVSSGIGFFLTPYIVKTVGAEAYGFVNLANNFISYAQILSVALNSMASRFITIKIHKNDTEGVNKYFTSILLANIILAIVTSVLAIVLVFNLNKIVSISNNILFDVKILWIFIFLNFTVTILGGTYGIATFACNRLDLAAIANIKANILKALVLVTMYLFLKPNVWYIGFASVLYTVYILFKNIKYTKKLLSDINVKLKYFDIRAIIEVVSSGIWNTLANIGQLLSVGIDLLVTNLYLGAGIMGTLSLAKTIPLLISNINSLLASVFAPELTIAYAKNDRIELIGTLKQSMKIMGIIVTIPMAMLIVYGDIFYSLWAPTENSRLLQILSIITISCSIIECSIMSIYYLFTAMNKVKENSIAVLIQGVLNLVFIILALKFTNLGIFAVAGVSTILIIIRNIIFTIPYAAKLLGLKWYTFFSSVFNSLMSVGIVSIISYGVRISLNLDGWIGLIIKVSISCIIGLVINVILFLNSKDRNKIYSIYKNKIRK